jgi:hypothetical protein
MILDERNEFCDATSAILAIGNAIIGDVIDLKPSTTNPNTLTDIEGSDQYLVIQVDTTIVAVGGTVKFALCSDSTADLATSKTTHFETAAIPAASLVAGYVAACVPVPMGNYERYLGIWETVAGTNASAGKINAFLTRNPGMYRAFADNA